MGIGRLGLGLERDWKQIVSRVSLVCALADCSECGSNVSQRWQNMTLVNYVLIGLLGTIVGIALYMAKVDISYGTELRDVLEQTTFS